MLPTNPATLQCQHCTPFKRQEFPSEQSFITFQNILDQECRNGVFTRVVEVNTSNNVFEDFYQCAFCNEDWKLSIPEYALRGYFLPKNSRTRSKKVNALKNHRRSCGCCLGMIFLIIASILYVLYSFFDFLIDAVF